MKNRIHSFVGKRIRFLITCIVFPALVAGGFFPALSSAEDFDPGEHQVPVVATITPVLPNVLLVVDGSGSMQNLVWEQGFDASNQYPLYRYGRAGNCGSLNCSGSGYVTAYNAVHRYGYVNKVTNGTEGSYDFGSTGATYDNNGAWYCYRDHDSFKGNLQISSAAYIVQSGGWIYGRRTTEDNNWISGEGWRAIKLPQFSDPITGGSVRYTDNYLAYLFETYTTASQRTADLTSIQSAKTRMMVAREVINSLIDRQQNNAHFGLMKLDYDTGGYLYNSSNPFGASASTIMSQVSNISASTWTPLGETLVDAYQNVFSQDISCQYECQNQFIVIMTDGEPAQDVYYPYGLKDSIDSYCNSDDKCNTELRQAMKAEFGDGAVPDTGFPWYNPCTNCRDSYNTLEGTSLLDGVAYMLNRMAEDDAGWPSKNGEKCQTVATYAIGFSIDHPLLLRTAMAGDGLYYTASSAEALASALDAALEDIFERTFSVAGLAFSSPNYRADETKLVSTRFSSADWSGDVIRRDLSITWNQDGTVSTSGVSGSVNASDNLPEYTSRTVYTTVDNQTLITASAGITGLTESSGGDSEVVYGEYDYVIGDASKELRNGGPFRDRLSVFGDVVHSRPAVADGMIYVGANDGFLHAIDLDSMVEQWVFIPSQLVNRTVTVGTDTVPVLKRLTDSNYKNNHLYYVDLAVNVHTFGNSTYLVAGFRGGAKGYFAMDVSSPGSPVLLWSRTSTDAGWENIGYSFSEPQLVRMLDGSVSKPVLIFGNGYGVNSSGSAISDSLFVVDIMSGAVLHELPTGVTAGGLSTPSVYGPNGWLRAVYAGDMSGNVWRFSPYIAEGSSATATDGWYTTKLYSTGSPITAQCNIAMCQGKPLVVGATGRYLTSDDISDTSGNYIFAVLDQEDGSEVTSPFYNKTLSGGERVTSSPEIVFGKTFVVAFTPDSQPCSFGGTSKIYSFNVCPDTSTGETFEETTEADVGYLITSNLGSTADEDGNTAIIAEDVNAEIHVINAPSIPDALTGWKPIRWQQSTVPAD